MTSRLFRASLVNGKIRWSVKRDISCYDDHNPAKLLFRNSAEYFASPVAFWEIEEPKRYPAVLVVYEVECDPYPSGFVGEYVELRDFELDSSNDEEG